MTETGGLPSMEALSYDLPRLLEADRATFALSLEALLSHRIDPDRVYFEILNGSSETVGMLLSVLTDPAEADNPESLSRRPLATVTPRAAGRLAWQSRVTCR